VPDLLVAHTADLGPSALRAVRALLDEVFAGDFTEADWEHALGGMHALVTEDDVLVAHGSVVQRRIVHEGRALRTGYVEGVGVRASARRRGHGGRVMAALERIIGAAYDLGALGSTDLALPFYTARGWRVWEGPTAALTPAGMVPTPGDDGGIHVLEGDVPLDRTATLVCDWRDGDVW
jgi:aminoglycoside 2'-N-acetyltransferase I